MGQTTSSNNINYGPLHVVHVPLSLLSYIRHELLRVSAYVHLYLKKQNHQGPKCSDPTGGLFTSLLDFILKSRSEVKTSCLLP